MFRHPVISSNIASIGYENSTLEVEFTNGSIYHYFNIPMNVYQGLMSASSHGQYLDLHIKKAGYSYTQIR